MASATKVFGVICMLTIVLPSNVLCQTCNAAAFTCPSTTSFQDCLDGTTPSPSTNVCPTGTFCDASCSSPCLESVPCSDKMCNSEAFYCTGDNPYDFLTCTADNPVPYPDVQTCMPGTVCSMFCPLPCWETPCPECKENGRVPVAGNESNYYVCILVEGGRPIYEEYTCPEGGLFDKATLKCVSTGQGQTTPIMTTTTTATPTTTSTTTPTTTPTSTTTSTTTLTPTTTPTTATTSTSTSTTTTTPTTTPTTAITSTSTPTTTTNPTTTPITTTITETITTPPSTSILWTTPTTTITPTTTTATMTTPSVVPPCTVAGRMADPTNCKKYFICSAVVGGGFSQSQYTCPGDSNFDPTSLKCSLVYTCVVPDSSTTMTTTTTTSTTTTPTTTTVTPTTTTTLTTTPTTTTIPTTQPVTTTTSTTTTPTSTTTKPSFVCPTATGKFADPEDCTKYFMCSASVAYSYLCPSTSLFDPTTSKCSMLYVCPV